ncbi:invasion associated locus B family protein [Pseudorhodobacter sp.]|uniref:invasion associated locus B family protein n=1 Tax=Pseudorhodobacter sp. TaxID=1934400 RepID=UPI002648A3E3|nr:invasion associated locus B family protein [Pseudorhodobacter sp.]MDN5786314.1 invasion associated locus B family protein [Pseudorhodobacter sp.]
MSLTRTAQLLATSVCLIMGSVAFAQDTTPAPETTTPTTEGTTTAPETTTPAPTTGDAATPPVVDGLSMGTEAGAPADGLGSPDPQASFGAWEQRCVKTADGADPCQLYQLLKDKTDTAVAEISIFGLPKGQQATAGATVIVPLETLLTAALTMTVDGSKPRVYPFSWCSNIGCISRIGFTQGELDGFKKGAAAKITIVPVVAPDQKVELTVSLNGFTAGYDAVNAANGN